MLVNSRFAKEHLEHLDENTKQVYLKHAIVIGLDFIDSKFGHNVDFEQLEQLTKQIKHNYALRKRQQKQYLATPSAQATSSLQEIREQPELRQEVQSLREEVERLTKQLAAQKSVKPSTPSSSATSQQPQNGKRSRKTQEKQTPFHTQIPKQQTRQARSVSHKPSAEWRRGDDAIFAPDKYLQASRHSESALRQQIHPKWWLELPKQYLSGGSNDKKREITPKVTEISPQKYASKEHRFNQTEQVLNVRHHLDDRHMRDVLIRERSDGNKRSGSDQQDKKGGEKQHKQKQTAPQHNINQQLSGQQNYEGEINEQYESLGREMPERIYQEQQIQQQQLQQKQIQQMQHQQQQYSRQESNKENFHEALNRTGSNKPPNSLRVTHKMRAQMDYRRRRESDKVRQSHKSDGLSRVPEHLRHVESKIKNEIDYHKQLTREHQRLKHSVHGYRESNVPEVEIYVQPPAQGSGEFEQSHDELQQQQQRRTAQNNLHLQETRDYQYYRPYSNNDRDQFAAHAADDKDFQEQEEGEELQPAYSVPQYSHKNQRERSQSQSRESFFTGSSKNASRQGTRQSAQQWHSGAAGGGQTDGRPSFSPSRASEHNWREATQNLSHNSTSNNFHAGASVGGNTMGGVAAQQIQQHNLHINNSSGLALNNETRWSRDRAASQQYNQATRFFEESEQKKQVAAAHATPPPPGAAAASAPQNHNIGRLTAGGHQTNSTNEFDLSQSVPSKYDVMSSQRQSNQDFYRAPAIATNFTRTSQDKDQSQYVFVNNSGYVRTSDILQQRRREQRTPQQEDSFTPQQSTGKAPFVNSNNNNTTGDRVTQPLSAYAESSPQSLEKNHLPNPSGLAHSRDKFYGAGSQRSNASSQQDIQQLQNQVSPPTDDEDAESNASSSFSKFNAGKDVLQFYQNEFMEKSRREDDSKNLQNNQSMSFQRQRAREGSQKYFSFKQHGAASAYTNSQSRKQLGRSRQEGTSPPAYSPDNRIGQDEIEY